MTLTTKPDTPEANTVTDRRRPGRLRNVSPELIPLLRTSEMPPFPEGEDGMDEADQLSGMRGVAFGVLLSAPIWIGVVYVGRWLLL